MDYATDPTFYGNQKQPLTKQPGLWGRILTLIDNEALRAAKKNHYDYKVGLVTSYKYRV